MKYSTFFLSFDETNAEVNWARLRHKAPNAVRIHGIPGILEAHRACAEASETPLFFVVDGDNEIAESFDFSVPSAVDPSAIHVWRCLNPVNDLVYGYGAVKLIPKNSIPPKIPYVDLATSMASKYRIVPELASITRFNTNPYSAWRAGFRECVKLSSQFISAQRNEESERRLEAWCSLGADRPMGEWCIRGARAGRLFGLAHQKDSIELSRINDYQWLFEQFEKEAHGKKSI